MRATGIVIFIALLLAESALQAQEAQPAQPDSTAVSVVDTIGIQTELDVEGEMQAGRITLDVKGVELNSVIRIFSVLSGANIILPEMDRELARAKVDVNLDAVPWRPALQAVLSTHGLELYEQIPGSEVYSVRKRLPPAEAARSTRVFLFHHADIGQAKGVIEGIVGGRGEVFAYPQGNTIVVKTTQEVMDDVAQVAERIDNARQQVLIEARILELTDRDQKDRGVDWGREDGGLLNRSLSMGPFTWVQHATNKWNFGQISPSTEVDPQGPVYTPPLEINRLTLGAGDIAVFLSALDRVANVQTVSSPKVIVANGETASIRIVTKEPIVISTPTYSEQGKLQSIMYNQDEDGTDPDTGKKRYATYDYGIMLDVTPTIYSTDNIAVHIVPTISRKDDTKTVRRDISGDDSSTPKIIEFPVIDEKRVETVFMLANRETAVIGGLTETEKEERERRVPVLGSIPVLRRLFTYNYTGNIQRENVIFVTVSLEDGKNFDVAKAVQTSPLTRRQLIREENDQILADREIAQFRVQDEERIR